MNEIIEDLLPATGFMLIPLALLSYGIYRWRRLKKPNLLRVAGFISVYCGIMAFGILQARHNGRLAYKSLEIGMNLKDIQWPQGRLVFAFCGNEIKPETSMHSKSDWQAIQTGQRELPLECRKMGFIMSGWVPSHASWELTFDKDWNISSITPLSLNES